MFEKIKEKFLNLFSYESSPHKLALACSLGIYIAFSPFFGLHTIMLIGAGLLFNLNVPLLLIIGYTVNNPFTMVPIYVSGYLLGHWILHTRLQIPLDASNPWWMEKVNLFLQQHVGHSHISLWGALVGGNVLGIALALLFYPILLYFFNRLSYTKDQ
jgi:uncharacterized protein (DUF2062 family)